MLATCGIAIAAIPFSAIPADAAILYSLDDGVLTIKSPEVIEKDGTDVWLSFYYIRQFELSYNSDNWLNVGGSQEGWQNKFISFLEERKEYASLESIEEGSLD